MKRFIPVARHTMLAALAAAALIGSGAGEAQAHGRVFIGGGVIVGSPYYAYPPYYGYPYYAYSPYYPYPPTYAPQPAYPAYGYAPPPAPADRYYQTQDDRYCREYKRTVLIDGRPSPAYGHACRQPDGTWQILD